MTAFGGAEIQRFAGDGPLEKPRKVYIACGACEWMFYGTLCTGVLVMKHRVTAPHLGDFSL